MWLLGLVPLHEISSKERWLQKNEQEDPPSYAYILLKANSEMSCFAPAKHDISELAYATETSSRPGLPICSSLNMLRTMTAQCWTGCSPSRLMPSQCSRPCCAAPSLPCGSAVEPTAARGTRRTDFSVKSRLKRLTWPPPTTRASASGRQTWAISPGS